MPTVGILAVQLATTAATTLRSLGTASSINGRHDQEDPWCQHSCRYPMLELSDRLGKILVGRTPRAENDQVSACQPVLIPHQL